MRPAIEEKGIIKWLILRNRARMNYSRAFPNSSLVESETFGQVQRHRQRVTPVRSTNLSFLAHLLSYGWPSRPPVDKRDATTTATTSVASRKKTSPLRAAPRPNMPFFFRSVGEAFRRAAVGCLVPRPVQVRARRFAPRRE